MNWKLLRFAPWLDTRASFVARIPKNGTLLDLGSSDGETLCHFAELRPDLRLHSVDIAGTPDKYPVNCQFKRADLQRDRLPWPDASMTAVTCMHLVEHLPDSSFLMGEVARLLAPDGRAYFETPHPRTVDLPSPTGNAAGTFTLNFHDDPTHIRVVPTAMLAGMARSNGLEIITEGISRNLLFAASHLAYQFLPASRRKFTAQVHWVGWSAFLIAQRAL